MSKKKLVSILLIALFVRLFFSVFQYSGDIKNHYVWGEGFLKNSVGFYSNHFQGFNDANYPPLAIYLFAASNLLYKGVLNTLTFLNSHIGVFPSKIIPFFITDNVRLAFLKLSGILSDVFIGLLVYKIFLKQKKEYAPLALFLVLFNPALIYISSVWGQIESITILFLIWSLYLSLYGKTNFQRILSLLIFTLACLSKQTALWFSPFFIILWLRQNSIKNLSIGLGSSLLLFFVSYIPFGLWPFEALLNYFGTLSGSSGLVSDAAWNIWFFIFPGRISDSTLVWGISIRNISITLLIISLSLIIFRLLKKYSTEKLLNSHLRTKYSG